MRNALDRIIGEYLAGKTEEELKEVLKDLDKAMFDALEEDKKRCDKFLKLAETTDMVEKSSKVVYSELRG